jgi:CheY-like chemotaxis protein
MPQVEVQNYAASGQHILVAENDTAIGCLITEILRSEGSIVTMVDSADAAATILERSHVLNAWHSNVSQPRAATASTPASRYYRQAQA